MLNLTDHNINWIEGELLGDGCLRSQSSISAYFKYGSQYLEYIDYVSGTLNSFGIEQTGHIYKRLNCYHYTSRAYHELKPLYDKWYPKGKKIVPRWLVLSPIVCRQWYIGDGSVIHRERGGSGILLCTEGLPVYDVEWLIERLNDVGFLATRRPSRNIICIAVCSTGDFLDYIGYCPVKCYEYKWDI